MAAAIDGQDFKQLADEASRKDAVAVWVHLAPASLTDIQSNPSGVKAAMKARADKLLAELGNEAWTEGKWDNGVGQIGLYVTAKGLQYLRSSGAAVSFAPAARWTHALGLGNSDGRLEAIERKLDADRAVNVVVTLDLPGMEYDLSSDGSWTFASPGLWQGDAKEKLKALLAAAGSQVQVLGNPEKSLPEVTLRTNLQGLLRLFDSGVLRSVRPMGFADARPAKFDQDVLQLAQRAGSADVVITLRDPVDSLGSPSKGREAALKSRKKALDAVLAQAGVPAGRLHDLSIFGAMAGTMSHSELEALKKSGDRRILSVELNAPVATAQLATSTKTMNMPAAWAAGYRAAGQNIIVMDTGVSSGHPFFRDAVGHSRVIYEGCFGSKGSVTENGVTTVYQSICPAQGQSGAGPWDSPSGYAGSAAPLSNCSSLYPDRCAHGTHVAGIAAGRGGVGMQAGVQGIAPDANIVALQVNSYDVARKDTPRVFYEDFLAALNAAVKAMNSSSTSNPFVVNLSFGGGSYNTPCGSDAPASTAAISTLANLGVPVVAATGNSIQDNGIAWPACTPKVIKVSALSNDGVGKTRAKYANLSDPAYFPGDPIWLAPGGDDSNDVYSSNLTGFGPMRGTSMAAPHVAGLYASVKAASPGITVAGVTAWLLGNAAVPLQISLAGTKRSFNGIRLPNF